MRAAVVAATALALGASVAAAAGGPATVAGHVQVSPLSVEIVRLDDAVRRGRWFRLVARVGNDGPTRLNDVRVRLVRPPGLRLDGRAGQVIPRIGAHGAQRVGWDVCSNTPGNYVLVVRARVDGARVESPAAVVQVRPSATTC